MTAATNHRYCQHHGVVPNTHRCRVSRHGTRAWRRLRAAVLQRDHFTCWCGQPATEVHHISDTNLRSVCFEHNPRGEK